MATLMELDGKSISVGRVGGVVVFVLNDANGSHGVEMTPADAEALRGQLASASVTVAVDQGSTPAPDPTPTPKAITDPPADPVADPAPDTASAPDAEA